MSPPTSSLALGSAGQPSRVHHLSASLGQQLLSIPGPGLGAGSGGGGAKPPITDTEPCADRNVDTALRRRLGGGGRERPTEGDTNFIALSSLCPLTVCPHSSISCVHRNAFLAASVPCSVPSALFLSTHLTSQACSRFPPKSLS